MKTVGQIYEELKETTMFLLNIDEKNYEITEWKLYNRLAASEFAELYAELEKIK